MKNALLLYVFIICVFSCNQTEKYQGKWTQNHIFSSDSEYPWNIMIQNDSIKLNYVNFDYWHEYSFNLKGRKLEFGSHSLPSYLEKDTLAINNSNYYVKDDNDSINSRNRFNSKIKILLPQITNPQIKFKEPKDYFSYIYFGRRHDNNEFTLQLNDKYGSIDELRMFLSEFRYGIRGELTPYTEHFLFGDKETTMSNIEKMFATFQKQNELKLYLVNDIKLNSNDSLGLYYQYEAIPKRLPPLTENDLYLNSVFGYNHPPFPPMPYSNYITEIPTYLLLINNKVYYNGKQTDLASIKNQIQEKIKKSIAIISLYDLNSNYKSFLELNAFVDAIYEDIRQENSTTKFNKRLTELSREEMETIKLETPKKYVWSYSIPHYESLLKSDKLFFGPNTIPIKNLMPMVKDIAN